MKRSEQTTEIDGWFTVSRAAALLGVPVPRIFDQIRDGKLQVRFEPGEAGATDRPFVTSAELKQRNGSPAHVSAASAPIAPSTSPSTMPTSSTSATSSTMDLPATAAMPVIGSSGLGAPLAAAAPSSALLEESRRTIARLERELADARAALDLAEQRSDAALKTIYERDVRIARLEAELEGRSKAREDAESFIRHLETRLDKTEERSEEKEKEIRRLAVGLGEARGEIRMLKPPAPEQARAWRRVTARAFVALGVLATAGTFGWLAFAFATRGMQREAAGTAAVAALAAFAAGSVLERLRHAR